jgi:GTP pyrophosphokinase
MKRPALAALDDLIPALPAPVASHPGLAGVIALIQRLELSEDPRVREAVQVVEVLLHLGADAEALAATLLHALGERSEVEALLSEHPRLRPLVEGQRAARKVWEIYRDRRPGEAEGLRRLLLAIIGDLRVVLILLARQLVRLRAAAALPAEAREALARLTFDIHAPLASRLGIWQLKWELEDLAFRHLHPETYRRIVELLDERRSDREAFIAVCIARLREALDLAGVRYLDLAGRPKHIFSIWKKMQRKGVDFGELYDIRAVRVLVEDVAACYAALGVVHSLWTPVPGEFDDYIAHPKANHYRSLHTAVIGPEGKTLEVQIRTREMHEHAELGVAAHWRYKEGGHADEAFERKIAWMRQMLLEVREEAEDTGRLLEGERPALVEDRVYVLTPQGRVVDLPAGATVLDFAYYVHTEVGHRCRGAKVNGRIVPLTHRPRSGDRVEIITGKEAEPRRDWLIPQLGYLNTARARGKVRGFFHRLEQERNIAAGRELIERELRKLSLERADLGKAAEKLRFAKVEDLFVAAALGDVTPAQIVRALTEAEPAPPPPPRTPARAEWEGGLMIEGVGRLLTTLARCCQPVAGEPIAGFVTRGRGVSVHRADCPQLLRLAARDPARVLEVSWGRRDDSRQEVGVLVRAFDRKHLLKDLTQTIAHADVDIAGVESRVLPDRGLAELRFGLKVRDFGQLSRLLAQIEGVRNVIEARRIR